MKKITFLLIMLIVGLGYSQTSNLVATGAHPDVELNGNGILQSNFRAPCSFSQPAVGAPNGYSITSAVAGRSVADDFTVAADEIFEPDTFTFVVALFDPNVLNSATIVFYADNTGLPGAAVATLPSQVPVSQNIVGTAFGRNLREVVFDLSSSGVTLSGGVAGTKYWVALENGIPNVADNPFWLAKDLVTGSQAAYKADGTVSWTPGATTFGVPRDMVFVLSGECNPALGDPPVIVCPGDIIVNNATGICGAVVNYSALAIDTEDGNITGDIVSTHPSGSTFPVGVTTVTLSVTDSDGNTSTCDFLVTVLDNEVPVAICQDLTVDLDPVTGMVTVNAADADNGSTDNCPGLTYMFGAGLTPGSLTTTFASNNGFRGNMFDIMALNDITISSFDVNADAGTHDYEVYMKTGSYVGSETNAADWTLVGSATGIVSAGVDNPTPLGLDMGVSVAAGNMVAFYIYNLTSNSINYVNGVTEGALWASDANLEIYEGVGKANPIFTGSTFRPRNFSGNIIYGVGSPPSPSVDFDCSDVGENMLTLTVTDASGNSSTCTTTVTVQDVTAPDITCIGGFGTFTETEDFESGLPAGWSTVVNTGTCDWINSGDMPTGDDFPTLAMLFDDDDCGLGAPASNVTLLSAVYDLDGASNVMVGYDVAFQESGTQTFTVEVFDGSAWQQIALYDEDLDPDIQTESIDASAFANTAFQVRWTFDDNGGEWGWGAGVDNFLLSYEASTGSGLDVFLDANGMASINPMDLLVNVNEACGFTVSIGGTGGGGMGSLSTLFNSNNGGAAGWAVMYDLTVGPNDIEVTDLDVNTSSTAAINLDMYTLVGTYVGNELNPGAWGSPVATGTGTGAGTDVPSNVTLAAPVTLSANTTYGIAIVMDVAPRYSGTGSDPSPGQLNYSNADISLDLGSAVSGLFTGSVFTPRIWNGTINYNIGGGSGSGLEFTCADLGENLIDVTVTDDSGNESTCTAIVNVIDLIAPVITCGPEPTISETVSDSPALAIPDNDPAGVSSTISITNDVTIDDLDINLNVSHTWVGDVITTITSPAGTSVTIVDRIGYTGSGFGCSGDDMLVTLDDAGTAPVEDQCGTGVPSIDGTFIPNNPLAAFNGESTLGDWTITISDNAGGDTGTLNSWGITYSYANTNTDIVIELGPDGTATIDPFDIISSVDEACGIDTAAVDINTVSCADIGSTILVTAFVSDTSGNIASCSANIIVVDLLAPELTCPADQTVDPGAGNLFYIVPDYFATGEATADDNCTDPVTITTQDPAPGTALPDGTYTITMTATDEYGNTSTCDFELTVDTVVGVDENSLDVGLALYPNPASTVVNLVNKTNISLEKMMIYDINGKLVNQTDLRTMQGEKAVDVSSLASGVYMVQIIGDNASTVKRLIKE